MILSLKKDAEEVYFIAVEFQLFSAAQGLLRHGLESVQNWTDNQQTVDTLFQVKQGQTVHTAAQAAMAKLDRKSANCGHLT